MGITAKLIALHGIQSFQFMTMVSKYFCLVSLNPFYTPCPSITFIKTKKPTVMVEAKTVWSKANFFKASNFTPDGTKNGKILV